MTKTRGVYAEMHHRFPTGKWVAEVVVKGVRNRQRFPTEAQAIGQAALWKAGASAEAATPSAPRTMLEVLERAADSLWPQPKWHGTFIKVNRILISAMGNPTPADINEGHLEDMIMAMRKQHKWQPNTQVKYLGSLMALLKWCKRRRYITEVPKMPWPRVTTTKDRWLSQEEEAAFQAALTGYGHPSATEAAAFLRAAVLTGMRPGELLGATAEMLDGNWLRLTTTKNGQPRSVALNSEAKAILEAHLPWTNLSRWQLRYWFDKAKAELGLASDRKLTIHTARHTAATRMLAKEGNLALVGRMLGHRRITSTMRYAHTSDADLLSAVQRSA